MTDTPNGYRTIDLTARFTVPGAFGRGAVEELAGALVSEIASSWSHLADNYGPEADGKLGAAYISAAAAETRIAGTEAFHRSQDNWGHSDRCLCHHPRCDHEAPEPEGSLSPCLVEDCACVAYVHNASGGSTC